MSARENVTLGRPDASDEDIHDAIDTAQAGFVYDLPWGLETRIGEQGMSLSGGQRQRLALARAVLSSRGSSCSTTRCRRSTSTPRPWSRRRCAGCSRTPPASWSPTAPRRSCSPTRWRCSRTARSPTWARTSELLAEVPAYRDLLAGRRRRGRSRVRAGSGGAAMTPHDAARLRRGRREHRGQAEESRSAPMTGAESRRRIATRSPTRSRCCCRTGPAGCSEQLLRPHKTAAGPR